MSPESLKELFMKSFQADINFRKRGINDYRIDVPFFFADGDSPKIILKEISDGSWTLSDEGHTSMYLSCHGIELKEKGSRFSVLTKILLSHFMENQEGRLVMENVRNDDITVALFTFVQGIMKVADMRLWKHEREKNLFMENFKRIIPEAIGKRDYEFNYYYPNQNNYTVDCMIPCKNGKQIHVYAANTDEKANESVISMYYFNAHGIKATYCAIFDGERELTRKNFNKVIDIADKTISSLENVPELLPTFLEKSENYL